MLPSEAPSSSLLKSVFTKCLALTFACAIVLMAASTYLSYAKTINLTSRIVSEMAIVSTVATVTGFGDELAAGQDAGAMQSARDVVATSNGLADLAMIFDADGRLVSASQDAPPAEAAALQALASRALQSGQAVQNFDTLDTAVPYRTASGVIAGAIAIDWSSASMVATIREQTFANLLIATGLLCMALAVTYYLLRHILGKPLGQLNAAVSNMAGGNYTTPMRGTARTDEFGALAQQLNLMRQSLEEGNRVSLDVERHQQTQTEVIKALRGSLKRLAAGKLSAEIREDFGPDYEDLVTDFNGTAAVFHDAIAQVVQLSDKIKQDSSGVKSYSDDLSRRTENQAATLEETAAALDDLTNGVRGAANGTREVEAIVQKARAEATESGEVVQKTIGAMSEISESSNQISAIIAVIDDIAFQTNLLALNAGVEAARAGEAGRGFAVVASEVRALAQRSSEAAHEIKTLISGSSEYVANGVALVAEAGEALTAITDRVVHIASLMSDMADNAQEQAASLDEINVGVGQLDQVTQRNASMVEEANTVTLSLEAQANALASMVTQFTLDDAQPRDLYVLQDRVA